MCVCEFLMYVRTYVYSKIIECYAIPLFSSYLVVFSSFQLNPLNIHFSLGRVLVSTEEWYLEL